MHGNVRTFMNFRYNPPPRNEPIPGMWFGFVGGISSRAHFSPRGESWMRRRGGGRASTYNPRLGTHVSRPRSVNMPECPTKWPRLMRPPSNVCRLFAASNLSFEHGFKIIVSHVSKFLWLGYAHVIGYSRPPSPHPPFLSLSLSF